MRSSERGKVGGRVRLDTQLRLCRGLDLSAMTRTGEPYSYVLRIAVMHSTQSRAKLRTGNFVICHT